MMSSDQPSTTHQTRVAAYLRYGSYEQLHGIALLATGLTALKSGAREHQHRVRQGMEFALMRGRMVGRPPRGLAIKHHATPNGIPDGISWEVDPETAPIIRKMYERRSSGASLSDIAAELNRCDLRMSSIGGARGTGWSASAVRVLLRNSIFKGIFVFRGSAATKARARKERRANVEALYFRPECRLVSDELWSAANTDCPGKLGGPDALANIRGQ